MSNQDKPQQDPLAIRKSSQTHPLLQFSPLWVAIQGTLILWVASWVSWLLTFVSAIFVIIFFIKQVMKKDEVKPAPNVVFITGASTGIGAALAEKYTIEGTKTIYITGRSIKGLEETVQKCTKISQHKDFKIIPVQLDVTDKEQMKMKLQEINKSTPIDVIIANAGISPEQQTTKRQEDIYYDTYNCNINGVLNTIFPIYDDFVRRKAGHIVIVSSIASFGSIAHPAYSSSKACMTTLGMGLRRDLKPYNVNVSVICPGYVRSNMTQERHQSRKNGLPFYQEQHQAVDAIYNGIQDNVDVIIFPLPLSILAWLLRIIPFYIQDYLALFFAKMLYRGDKNSTDALSGTTTSTNNNSGITEGTAPTMDELNHKND